MKSKSSYLWVFAFFIASQGLQALTLKKKESSGDNFLIVLNQKPVGHSNKSQFKKNQLLLKKTENKIEKLGGKVLKSYSFVLMGFLVKGPPTLRAKLKKDPSIMMIAKNSRVYTTEKPSWVRSWGLDRINQVDLPLDSNYEGFYRGRQIHAYIIDSGIRKSHQDFTTKVLDGYNAIDNSSPNYDCIGHGSHVAGTVGGRSSGVAKNIKLHPVKVFACQGATTTDIILDGMDWVIENHKKPAVINMSLGGPRNLIYHEAVRNATDAGIHVVVSAGNDGGDACLKSPASAPEAITVAASTNEDKLAFYSNWGSCVDIIAPGSAIVSASHQTDDSYSTKSGTSMSSPHVAGVVALALEAYPKLTPAAMSELITSYANKDKIADSKMAPNLLLYMKKIGTMPFIPPMTAKVYRRPNNYINILASAYDPDGFLVKTYWNQISGPEIKKATPPEWKNRLIFNKLPLGHYVFRYEAMDNEGNTSSEDIDIYATDSNLPPFAKTGGDSLVKILHMTHYINGDQSYDLDGTIESYLWEQISGPNELKIHNKTASKTKISEYIPGVYNFKLTITDNEGATSEDTIEVIVNHPPVAHPGEDQILYLPKTKTTLTGTGTDVDGTIEAYSWIQKDGPVNVVLKNRLNPTVEATGFTQPGIYTFSFKVADNLGAQSSGKMFINVKL